jgi:hypothetical protein
VERGLRLGLPPGKQLLQWKFVQRSDGTSSVFQLTPNPDCGVDLVSPIAFQSMWVVMDPSASTFLELGTAIKTCTNGTTLEFWYVWIYTQVITGGATHRFFVVNGTDQYWRWYVDQTQVYAYKWPNLGFYDEAGLESHDQYAHIHENFYNGMVKTINWGAWTGWQPTKAWSPSLSPPMYGNFTDQNDGFAYESTP